MTALTDEMDQRVRERAMYRCEYCLSQQRYVMGVLEVEHIQPVSKGGSDHESNLALACHRCNNHKSAKINVIDPDTGEDARLFHPRQDIWTDHFQWSEDGTEIIGQTPIGRATIIALNLNHPNAVEVRRAWVAVGWHPPYDA